MRRHPEACGYEVSSGPRGGAVRSRRSGERAALLAVLLALSVSLAQAAEDAATRLAELRREIGGAHPPPATQISSRLNDIAVDYLKSGDSARALELLSEAVGEDPENGEALANLILTLVKQEDFEFAEFYLEQAEATESHNPDPQVYRTIGDLYAARNRLREAVMAWGCYRRLGGSDPATLAHLERALRELSVTPGQRLLESDHFSLYTDAAVSPEEAQRAEAYLEQEYRHQSPFFATEFSSPQVVILYSGRAFFSLVSVPDWVSGVFDGKIRISLDPDRGLTPQLQNVLSHELAHAMIRQVSADRAPGWLHEGLAQWWEGKRLLRSEFRQAMGGHSPYSLAQMEGNLARKPDRPTARANYAEALGLIEYLVAERGMGSIMCLLHDLGDGLGLGEALQRETGLLPEQLVSQWKVWAHL